MVLPIAFQENVRRSFSRTKEDVLNLKRTMNREFVAIEKLAERFQFYTSKQEFYDFISSLTNKLEKIEESAKVYNTFEEELKHIELRFKTLNKKIERRENLEKEVREIRKLRGRIASLEGSSVDSGRYSKDIAKIHSEVSSHRRSMLTDREFNAARDKIGDTSKEVKRLKDSSVSYESFDGKINELEKIIGRVKERLDFYAKSSELSNYVTKSAFSDKFAELEMKKIRKSLEHLGKDLRREKENSASAEEVRRLRADISKIAGDVNGLKESIKRVAERAESKIAKDVGKLSARVSKDLSRMGSDNQAATKKRGKAGRSGSRNFMGSVGKGISDFFGEEEEDGFSPPKSPGKKK